MEVNTAAEEENVTDKAGPGKHRKKNQARRAKAKAEKAELDAFVAGVESQIGDGSPLADFKFMVYSVRDLFEKKDPNAMHMICGQLGMFLQRREKGPPFTDQELNYVNEIADKMVPGRAGPEPTYAPRVITRMLLPTSDDISPQVSAETGDETPDDTYAKDPPLNEAGKEVMTTRNKVAAGFVRRSWDPHFEIQRDEKPFTEEELAYTTIIEGKIANHTGIDWSLTAYRAITVVMPLLLRRDELARQIPTDAVIHDMALCEEEYEYYFASFARIFKLVVPLGKGRLCNKCSHQANREMDIGEETGECC